MRRSKKTKSAEVVASIDDRLVEILLCLPLKPLVRCKSVSKHWKSLLGTNPKIINSINPNPNSAVGFFVTRDEYSEGWDNQYFRFSSEKSPPQFEKVNFPQFLCRSNILQSCNGLLLLSSNEGDFRTLIVYNPTTRNYFILPELDGRGQTWRSVIGTGLAFDPTISPYYHVVCVVVMSEVVSEDEWQVRRLHLYKIFIYSSKTGLWTPAAQPPFRERTCLEVAVYWNGALHWMFTMLTSYYFNIENQVLRSMPKLPGRWSGYYVGESRGHLHCTQLLRRDMVLLIHELERDYSRWFIKYRVDLSLSFASVDRVRYDSWSVLSVVEGDEMEDAFMILQLPQKVLRYNLGSKTFVIYVRLEDVILIVDYNILSLSLLFSVAYVFDVFVGLSFLFSLIRVHFRTFCDLVL
ncbi:hypothetical protein OROHE_014905 [Orobanche hederae]